MESTAFFEKEIMEGKCSEQGFVLPGSVELLSRSMGYFESARFTGDAIYYLKLKGQIVYPVDGMKVSGKVIRKNKMGLYINYKDAIRIQVPRDLHLDLPEFEDIQVGETVEVELKRSKFAIHDSYILASGMFLSVVSDRPIQPFVQTEKTEEEVLQPVAEQSEAVQSEEEEQSEAEEQEQEDDEEDED
jgi:hypothetical protein